VNPGPDCDVILTDHRLSSDTEEGISQTGR
jgi:hypothetical protein